MVNTWIIAGVVAIGILWLIILVGGILFYRMWRKDADRAQQEKDELRASLEKYVQESQNQSRQIEEYTRERRLSSNMLPAMSHELRTPLNSILGFADLLSKEGNLSEQATEYVELIRNSGYDLLGVISNIMYFSHVTAGQLQLHPSHFDFKECCDEVLEILEISARKKKIDFIVNKNFDSSFHVYCDRGLMKSLLLNLVGNAIKFTDKGKVTFSIERERIVKDFGEDVNYRLRFTIEDTGVGIPHDEFHKIFQPYYQIHRAGEGTRGGTGLGLALVHQIVTSYNGELEFSPEKNGSVFFLTLILPGRAGAKQLKGGNVKLKVPISKSGEPAFVHHILIAEDNVANARLLEIGLKKMGHSFKTVGNGLECIDAMQRQKFDLVLMDIQMPVLNGELATKRIRAGQAGEHNKDIPIVAVTSFALASDQERLTQAGINYYLAKPTQMQLLAEVLQHIGRRKIDPNIDPVIPDHGHLGSY